MNQSESSRPGLQFDEIMKGYFSTEVKDDYEQAAQRGKEDDSPFEFAVTILSDDLDQMLKDQHHEANIEGSATAPRLSAHPLTVTEGRFNLFSADPDRVSTREMRYRMKLTSQEGEVWYFDGFKVIHNDPGFDMWSDTTTLYITIHNGGDTDSPVLGKGVLKIMPADFLRLMTTLRVNNAQNIAQRLATTVKFGRFFAGALFQTYGGVLAKPNAFGPDAPPRTKRALRAPAPEVHFFTTSDGVQLKFTRYEGGAKGPVILSPGFGTSSLAFSIDTVDPNLPEYLCHHGYDVWLLDYRASPDLPSAETQFTVDDIATKDYPAALDKVRAVTEAESVQVMAHCVGSMSFVMAMLAGLQGVRSAVCSQLATHPVSPTLNELRAGLHLGSFLSVLGMEGMTTDFDASDWKDRLLDKVSHLYPTRRGESCDSPVCRRIRFMYGEVYKHDQLNDGTHDALYEMFGTANASTLKHMAEMVRQGHIVDKDGEDVYLPHLERLAIPIAFIHGAENGLFLPKGTEITYDLLSQKNGKHFYTRHVIPGYAHMDCFLGKDAAKDVFPIVLAELEKENAT